MSSQKYHAIFDYPLDAAQLKKWQVGRIYQFSVSNFQLKNKRYLWKKRKDNEQSSKQKLIIAKRVSELLSKISTIKFVGITGALAMMNAGKDSDIDLLIITKKNTLWLTRLITLMKFHRQIRRAGNSFQKDKLCLNMWFDEDDLVWPKKDRNIYTAHEIAQIVPLVNKDNVYEKFLYLNRWILSYWPYAVSINPYSIKRIKHTAFSLWQIIEKISFWIQFQYMKPKITREVITPTRAIFHPNDWGKVVLSKLSS